MGEEKQVRERLWDAAPGYDFIEEVDVPEMHSYFMDAGHSIPPLTPLAGQYWIRGYSHGTQVACAELSVPTCGGWEGRYMEGASYACFLPITDPKLIEERQAKFRVAMIPWIENFDGLWDKMKQELLDIYNKLKAVDVDNASNVELKYHNWDLKRMYMRMFEIHFLGMYASYNAWMLLEDICKERFGMNDHAPEFQDMMAGFPNKVYDMDKKLWEFGKLATDSGLADVFKNNEPEAIQAKLEQSDKGKDWLKQFIHYLETDDVGGWRMRRFVDFTEPYWLEDPSTPLGLVRNHILQGMDYSLDDKRKELVKKREKAIAALLSKVPPNEKELVQGLITLAGKTSAFSEEHDLYCELMSHAFMRRGYLAIGRRLTQHGTIDRPEDVFMLNPDEIDRVMINPAHHSLRFVTQRRRAEWERWHKAPKPPLFTHRSGIEEAIGMDMMPSGDPVAIKIVVGDMPVAKPELKADLFGICGCAGESEGTARVLFTHEELKQVQPGDILVCSGTDPNWTPVFGIVNGVVTDRGGILSHAAIIGREYGVPTIVNTFEGTASIKPGQRLRINATEGAVYILDK
jgi:pyruvate,water dikinase